jgi:hypothetical protein
MYVYATINWLPEFLGKLTDQVLESPLLLHRKFPQARQLIIDCDLEVCPICGIVLKSRRPWPTRKTIQTLQGPLIVAGKSKECANPSCRNYQKHYYASRVWLFSLPDSSYGLDGLAFIAWQHEHEHRQLLEIYRELIQRGVVITERKVGKLYRQLLALLGASSQSVYSKLEATVKQYGGLI